MISGLHHYFSELYFEINFEKSGWGGGTKALQRNDLFFFVIDVLFPFGNVAQPRTLFCFECIFRHLARMITSEEIYGTQCLFIIKVATLTLTSGQFVLLTVRFIFIAQRISEKLFNS